MEQVKKHESNVRGYSRSFPVTFTSANGAVIHDTDHKQYIDFLAGAGALNYGHNNPFFKMKLMDYIDKNGVTHGLDLSTEAKEHFINIFNKYILEPRELKYKMQFTGPTGTNTVEAAIKLAQIVTGRTNIITFTNGYHGHSKGALRLTANAHYRKGLENELNQFTTFIPYYGFLDGDFDSADYLDKILSDSGSGTDIPAAIILETIQGEGGVNIAPKEWLQKLRRITEKHDILMIVDDIQVGCGRTGNFFSFEDAGIYPDMVTLSKSLSGYGLPMSLLLIKPEIDDWKPGQHTGTFRGNNLAFVTAAEAIIKYWKDDEFTKETLAKSSKLLRILKQIGEDHKEIITDVRGKGLIAAVECTDAETASSITAEAFDNGLIIETCGSNGNIIKFLPPLNIHDNYLNEGIKIFEQAVQSINKVELV
ncbi:MULTISPECIES: diaminobutyrate--2-oxoglutarate transaminase [Reichenbachiella]|uniref:diaminobutyrate--2-oxoglutarate transaminase n=1 Tax=Reichenbachiella TaxID=156993 RepID=UPI000E6C5F89|nr:MULTISPECIES: diaminobutyrate--2-oxoglutarate transaminase [Reichenbachiella]MBU2915392.1 diaminobutyrate--2-oxoglutarate transaminase [Reichenbachiella agariperforans]RJE71538.1 diaminobutyrate--2-oxoglutarate transaminase [Reichenbachiella sp. MSK19-1]